MERQPGSEALGDEAALTARDRELIAEQLRIQEAETQAEADNFTAAYADAKTWATYDNLSSLTEDRVAEMTLRWAKMTYPDKNAHGLRNFQPHHGKTGEIIGTPPGSALENDLAAWCHDMAAGQTEPDELYQRFEMIHPFDDGNGRVGDLWWKVAVKRQIGQWPTSLPPDYEPPQASAYESAFGDVEH